MYYCTRVSILCIVWESFLVSSVRTWKCRNCWARWDCLAHSRYSRNICLLQNIDWSLGRLYSCALTIESSLAMTFAFWFLCQQLPAPSFELSLQAWTPSYVREHLNVPIVCNRYTCRMNHSRTFKKYHCILFLKSENYLQIVL